MYDPQNFRKDFDTPLGQALWAFLNEPDNVVRLETASELGVPALRAVSGRLLERLGAAVKADRAKQMAGHMVRQILERRGFVLVRAGRAFRGDPVYTSAAVYAPERM